MADIVDAKKRSEMMSKIRGTGNKTTELAFIAAMRKAGIKGWRRHVAFRLALVLPGRQAILGEMKTTAIRPDFVFRNEKLVVFIDGCFWHRCPKHSSIPKQNTEFWLKKLEMNVARDTATTAAFKKKGWRVMRVWEHELLKQEKMVRRLTRRLTP
jgi:DNA mismatch endonuclease (patch repair protein)